MSNRSVRKVSYTQQDYFRLSPETKLLVKGIKMRKREHEDLAMRLSRIESKMQDILDIIDVDPRVDEEASVLRRLPELEELKPI